MRILVCGGRNYSDYIKINWALEPFDNDDLVIIHGDARGADSLANLWAITHKRKVEKYPAKWEEFGKKAGYMRNRDMLEKGKPDCVIAFPGGKGTAMMIKIAKEANVHVIEIKSS